MHERGLERVAQKEASPEHERMHEEFAGRAHRASGKPRAAARLVSFTGPSARAGRGRPIWQILRCPIDRQAAA